MIDRLLHNNTAAKIISILLAFVLWFYITGDTRNAVSSESTRPFDRLPITVYNLPDFHVITEMEREVDIVLQGSAEDLADITLDNLDIYVDLSGFREGQHTVRVRSSVPPDIKIQKLSPSSITVVIEEVVTSQMEVIPVLKGEPGEGLIAGEVTVEPQNVLVKGTRNVLSQVNEVVVMIDVDGAVSEIKGAFPVTALDAQGREVDGVEIEPEEVEVYVDVQLPEAEFFIEVVWEGELPEGLEVKEVSVEPKIVTLSGLRENLEMLETVKTFPVNLTDREESFSYEVDLEVPQGTSLKKDSKILVNVVIGTADE